MSRALLIIDDEPTIRGVLRHAFELKRFDVAEAATGGEGLDAAAATSPDVVLLDVKLPDMDGLDVLSRLKEQSPASVVLIMTAHGDVEMAVEAVRNRGAFWFFQKPIDMAILELQVERALDHAHAQRRGDLAEQRAARLQVQATDLGESEGMKDVERLVRVVAASPDTTVLLLGQSGSGKGVVAESIHRLSPRRSAPFQEINCAGLSETFLETELFGAERGAYTDAKNLKRGLLELADGGTVFLDEIGDLAPALQPKLLKVLEGRRFRRLGGVRDIEVNVRIVAATNHDLAQMVKEGRFREDLYYRLNVMSIQLPPLRERGRDVLVLAQRFIAHFNRTLGRQVEGFTPEADALLLAHSWPGNVRELKNVVERGMILCPGDRIGIECLPVEIAKGAATAGRPASAPPAGGPAADPAPVSPGLPAPAGLPQPGDALMTMDELERLYISEALARCDDNRSKTAQVLGISRSTLIEKIKKYGLGG